MIIVISQSKLVQRAGLWMWHTSCGSGTMALLHNHRMRNSHLYALAVVMATCSYGLYIWRTGGIGYSLVLLI